MVSIQINEQQHVIALKDIYVLLFSYRNPTAGIILRCVWSSSAWIRLTTAATTLTVGTPHPVETERYRGYRNDMAYATRKGNSGLIHSLAPYPSLNKIWACLQS